MGQRRLKTEEDFDRALRQGFGLGERKKYKPWHRVQDFASRGQSSKIQGITVERTHHVLSNVEKKLFLHVEREKSVVDIREQFPILPRCLTEAIAKEIGIKHPVINGTRTSWVLSVDILATHDFGDNATYSAFAAKISTDLMNRRTLELLELQRLACKAMGIPWFLVTERQVEDTVSSNLDWASEVLRGRLKRTEAKKISDDLMNEVATYLSVGTFALPILVEQVAREQRIDEELALILLRILIWEQKIDVDLSISIQRSASLTILSQAASSSEVRYDAVGQ